MDDGNITIKKCRLGKLKITRQSFLQRYEHQTFVSLLTCLYSCRWRRYEPQKLQSGECCCTKGECAFYPVLLAALCFSFAFVYMWGEARNDYNAFDWFSYINLHVWFLWSIMLLLLAAFCFSYVLLLLILAMCLVSEGQQLHLHCCHKIGAVFVLILSISVLAVITVMWNVQWKTFILSMQFTSPFLHVVAVFCMVLLSWPVALYTFRLKKKVLQVMVLVPYLALLLFLFFIPLSMYSPCIQEKGKLGPKPALIGHRGAPMVAPENTRMSFMKTVEHGGDGLETDVAISYDGVPFLMHDDTLMRTTNIQEVRPSDAHALADTFTWDVLKTLNSGKWFFKNKPFSDMPEISSSDRKEAEKQVIYKFIDFLKLADQENKLVIFDLRRPSELHPFRHNWVFQTLQVITESRIKPHLVLWLDNTYRSHVREAAPGFQQTFGRKAPVEQLKQARIVKLNLSYREMSSNDIRKYAEANITTNFYVVNQPWLFSLAWCAGAHSVTTDTVHILKKMTKPLFLMTPQEYQIMWILTDVLALILISPVFLLHWWREKGASCCSGSRTDTFASGPYSTFGTDLNTMPTVA